MVVSALSALAYAITALALGPLVVLALIVGAGVPKLQKIRLYNANGVSVVTDAATNGSRLRRECILSGECGTKISDSLIVTIPRNRLRFFPQSRYEIR